MLGLARWCHLPIAVASQNVNHILGINAQHSWLASASTELPNGNTTLAVPFADQVWQTGQPLIIANALNDPVFQNLPQVQSFPHLNCYAGVPIVGDRLGQIGVLSVMGYTLHQVQADIIDLLELVAHEIVGVLGDRPIYDAIPPHESRTINTVRSSYTRAIALAETTVQRLRLLQQTTSVLQGCGSLYKAQPILPEFLQRLFPGSSGQVLIYKRRDQDKNQKTFELVTCWGSLPDACNIEWFNHPLPTAMEQLMSVYGPSKDTLLEYNGHLCSPMQVNRRLFGLLVLTSDIWQGNGTNIPPSEKQFIQEVTQHLAITLHTLHRIDVLQQESLQDPLTGLYNRRHMMSVLDTMLRRANYGNDPLSIIMLDIDYFKRLNDSFGHPAGDQVLRDLGIFLKGFIRPTDVACRYGGEEFALILMNADKQIAMQRAERIRHGIAYITMKYQGRSLGRITVSQGIATFPEDGRTIAAIIQAADEALYQAKANGRNRSEVAPPKSQPTPKAKAE
jgi:diguanylate cyclase (GGDEF)-like protein